MSINNSRKGVVPGACFDEEKVAFVVHVVANGVRQLLKMMIIPMAVSIPSMTLEGK